VSDDATQGRGIGDQTNDLVVKRTSIESEAPPTCRDNPALGLTATEGEP